MSFLKGAFAFRFTNVNKIKTQKPKNKRKRWQGKFKDDWHNFKVLRNEIPQPPYSFNFPPKDHKPKNSSMTFSINF